LKEINTFIQQGFIELIKSGKKGVKNVIKDFNFILFFHFGMCFYLLCLFVVGFFYCSRGWVVGKGEKCKIKRSIVNCSSCNKNINEKKSILNKCCSFELSVHQSILKKNKSIMVSTKILNSTIYTLLQSWLAGLQKHTI